MIMNLKMGNTLLYQNMFITTSALHLPLVFSQKSFSDKIEPFF